MDRILGEGKHSRRTREQTSTVAFSNAGVWDRAIRISLGLLMLILGWYADLGALSLFLRVFALFPLVTGLIGWCPVYALLRISTRR